MVINSVDRVLEYIKHGSLYGARLHYSFALKIGAGKIISGQRIFGI
jgi:hypothetical protein